MAKSSDRKGYLIISQVEIYNSEHLRNSLIKDLHSEASRYMMTDMKQFDIAQFSIETREA